MTGSQHVTVGAICARSLLLAAPRQLEWRCEDLPAPGPDEVLVETRAGAISIGTELPQYLGTARTFGEKPYPRMTGYESLGTVIACGSHVRERQVGDRVAAFYGHRSHAIVPASKTIRVPHDVSDKIALFTILSCDAAKGVRKVFGACPHRESLRRAILVTGAGTMGLLTLFILRALGAAFVDVVEPRPERRALARDLGARLALAPDDVPESAADQYSAAFECSSRDTAFALAQSSVEREGRICILADGNLEPLVLAPIFHEKELSIVGSSDGWDYQQHAARYFEVVRRGWTHLERIFDYRTSADGLSATFERLAMGEIAPIKVFVEY